MFGTSWTCWQGMDVHATLRGFNNAESTWLILNNRAQKSQNVAKDIQRLSLWRSVLVNSCEFLGRYLAVLDYPALRARLWRYLPWRSVPQASPAVMRWCRAIELLTSTSFLGCPWSMNQPARKGSQTQHCYEKPNPWPQHARTCFWRPWFPDSDISCTKRVGRAGHLCRSNVLKLLDLTLW